jgi:hypothetical protein
MWIISIFTTTTLVEKKKISNEEKPSVQNCTNMSLRGCSIQSSPIHINKVVSEESGKRSRLGRR